VVQYRSVNVAVEESIMRNLIRGLLPAFMLALLPVANAAVFVGVSVNIAPPVLPVYVQPAIPAPGYLWTPGYWAWGPAGYYWVPGTWVSPPTAGVLWTPGYWGWVSGAYLWHAGYWGPHVGFYGGVNYGFGYRGVGYEGGYWHGNQFLYNTTVNNVHNISVTNVYTRTVVNTGSVSRVSFNGGAGGIVARASPAELSAAHERHVAFTSAQHEHENMARANTSLRASVNGGHPAIAATPRPGAFSGHGVVAAREPGGYPAGAVQSHNERPAQAGGAHSQYPPVQSGGGYPGQPQGAQGHSGGHESHAEHEGRG
jgi:WXXGXW repeat (2 copies)